MELAIPGSSNKVPVTLARLLISASIASMPETGGSKSIKNSLTAGLAVTLPAISKAFAPVLYLWPFVQLEVEKSKLQFFGVGSLILKYNSFPELTHVDEATLQYVVPLVVSLMYIST